MTAPRFPDDASFRGGAPAPITLAGPAGPIEAIIEAPEPDAAARPVVAILCHPLPTEGGTMHNKVVTMAARALHQCGVGTVRFNFRGTGESAGQFDHGIGEADDLRAVAAWVRAQRPDAQLWLVGFSFGAYVAYKTAPELDVAMLVLIAPPAGRRWDFATLPEREAPWLVIQGEADEVVDPNDVYTWIDGLKQPPELVRMPDTSHFFHRKLMDLRGAIKHGVRAYLPAPTAPPERPAADA